MTFKHAYPLPSPIHSYHTRRSQRCLTLAIIFILVIISALYHYQQSWPKTTLLHLDTLNGLLVYGSKPEAGRPNLPYKDSAERISDDEPWFEWLSV